MDFDQELRRLFTIYLHYQSESPQTNECQNELQKLWETYMKKHKRPPDLTLKLTYKQTQQISQDITQEPPLDFHLDNRLKLIKFLARRHGLPDKISSHLSKLLSDTKLPLDVKYQTATILKFCTLHDHDNDVIKESSLANKENLLNGRSFNKLLTHLQNLLVPPEAKSNINCHHHNKDNTDELEHDHQDSDHDPVFTTAIISQLVQSISIKLTPVSWEENKQDISKVLKLALTQCDFKTQAMVQNKLTKLGVNLHNTKIRNENHSKEGRVDLDQDNSGESQEPALFSTGSGILCDMHQARVKSSGQNVKADAVKTQQAVTSVFKQNVSEKSQLEAINLTNALNSTRGRNKSQRQQMEVNETINNSGSSVRLWYRTTGAEVANFLYLARNNQIICDDDIDYLRNKLVGWRFNLSGSSLNTSRDIATIFSIISKNHDIKDSIIVDLAKYAFTEKLEETWGVKIIPSGEDVDDLIAWNSNNDKVVLTRNKLLKAFKELILQARRNGKLPSEVQKVLTKFCTTSSCTNDMKKKIWAIFRSNDDNLHKAFPPAIDQIYEGNLCGSEATENDVTYLKSLVEYAHEQVVVAEKAAMLQEKYRFFDKLVTVVTNTNSKDTTYPDDIRSKVSFIVCDMLDHDKIPGLNRDAMKLYCKTFEALVNKWNGKSDLSNKEKTSVKDLKSNIIKTMLKTFAKDDIEGENITFIVLELLMLAITDCKYSEGLDRDLEAHVMVTLGNLSIKFKDLNMPGAERLACKITKEDAVDPDGEVHFSNLRKENAESDSDDDESEKSKEKAKRVPEDYAVEELTYMSAMAGQILLRHFQSVYVSKMKEEPNLELLQQHSTLGYLMCALQAHTDKTTRIYAAECFWVLSLDKEGLPKEITSSIKQFADDKEPVYDVKVFSRGAYFQALERVVDTQGKEGLFRQSPELFYPQELQWLIHAYPVDKLSIDTDDYSHYVNQPILKILKCIANNVNFPDAVFQLLTYLLSTNNRDPRVSNEVLLEILANQIKYISSTPSPKSVRTRKYIPLYCQRAIQDLFIGSENSSIQRQALQIILQMVRDLGQILDGNVIDELYSSLQTDHVSQENQTSDYEISLVTLLYAVANQDISTHICTGVIVEFAANRLAACLKNQHLSTAISTGILGSYSRTDGTENTILKWRGQLLSTLLNHISRGQRVSFRSLHVIELCLKYGVEPLRSLECLTLASENGQDLSATIIKAAFSLNSERLNGKKEDLRQVQMMLPRLALALANNNQSLDETFLCQISTNFCATEDYQVIFSLDDNISHKTLAILTKLVQNNQPFQMLSSVVDKLCDCFGRKEEASHHQMLEILQALVSFVVSGRDRENFPLSRKLKKVFLLSLRQKNCQFQQTGLYGFISLESTRRGLPTEGQDLTLCDYDDFKLLVNIHQNADTSPAVKNIIQDFLSSQNKIVPHSIRRDLNLSNFDDKSDSAFVADLNFLVKEITNNGLFEGVRCQNRICEVLMSSNVSNIQTLLEILKNYSGFQNIPQSTFESIGFTMVNCTNEAQHIKSSCRDLLSKAIDLKLPISKTLKTYIEADHENDFLLEKVDGLNTSTPIYQLQGILRKYGKDDSVLVRADARVLNKVLEQMPFEKYPDNFLHILYVLDQSENNVKFSPTLLATAIGEHIWSMSETPESGLLKESAKYFHRTITTIGQELDTIVFEGYIKILNWVEYIKDMQVAMLKCLTDLYETTDTNLDYGKTLTLLKLMDKVLFLHTNFRSNCLQIDDFEPNEDNVTPVGLQDSKNVPYKTAQLLIAKLSNSTLPPHERQLVIQAFMRIQPSTMNFDEGFQKAEGESIRDGKESKGTGGVTKKLGSLFKKLNPMKSKAAVDKEAKEKVDQDETVDQLNTVGDKEENIVEVRLLQQSILEYLSNLHVDIFTIIHECDEIIAEREVISDLHFANALVEFLLSITYWDLKSVSKVKEDCSLWVNILHSSDFLSTFANSKSEEFAYQESLECIYEQFKKIEIEEAVKYQVEFLQILNQRCRELPRSLLPQFLSSLSKLEIETSMDILKHPNFLKNWKPKLDQAMLVASLAERLSAPTNSRLIHSFVNQILEILPFEFALTLIQSMHKIPGIQSLQPIWTTLQKLQITDNLLANTGFISNIATGLSVGSMSASDVHFLLNTQIVLTSVPLSIPRRGRIQRILESLIRNGISIEDLKCLVELTKVQTNKKGQDSKWTLDKSFEHFISQSSQYQVTPALFHDIVEELKNEKNMKKFINTSNKKISEGVFDGKSGVKDLGQIISEFQLKNASTSRFKWKAIKERFIKTGYQWDILKLKILQVKDCERGSKVFGNMASIDGKLFSDQWICNWDVDKVRTWARCVKMSQIEHFETENDFYLEALMVTRRAITLKRNFHLTDIQILSCILALQKLDKDKEKGQLQQVATGSGKSAIIAVLSTIKALYKNQKVDVYTSSPVLAERDAKEWSQFYEMFDLSCSHNADKGNYISGPKSCYRRDIVYGDCSQFQFDFLRDKYSDLKTLSGRTYDYAIIDEVDNMFLDDSTKLARLSSTLHGMDLLEILYHFIWDRVGYLKDHLFSIGTDQMYYIEGKVTRDIDTGFLSYDFIDYETRRLQRIDDIFVHIVEGKDLEKAGIYPINTSLSEFVQNHLINYANELICTDQSKEAQDGKDKRQEVKVKLPPHLQEFATTQIPRWVDSALTALTYQENVHYVIDNDQIKPVDYMTTGIVQGNTSWNNGLHQFLGLKHSLKIKPETVTTNFLSNAAMFKKYGSNILGFTGTLGSAAGRSVLYKIYKVNQLYIPETYFKRYRQFPDVVLLNEDDWLKEIIISTLEESSKGRAVLVICETILKAEVVSQALRKFPVKVKAYTKNVEEGDSEKHIERAHPGDVIVATNLAGRGTDIKTLEVEPSGGLHVVLTFLPQSQRIDEQAFGRTSRQGNKGTGQLIIVKPADCSASNFKQFRDEKESKLLEVFQNVDYSKIEMQDKLFREFTTFFQTVRDKLKQDRILCGDGQKKNREDDGFTVKLFKAMVHNTHKFDKENTLDTTVQDEDLTMSTYESTVLQSVEIRWAVFLRGIDKDKGISYDDAHEKYLQFQNEVQSELEQGTLNLLRSAQNPFYFIVLGNSEYSKGVIAKADEYYEIALDIDKEMTFSAGAVVGKASCLLNQSKGTGFREKALDFLRDALPLLYEEMSMITVKQTMVQKNLALVDPLNQDMDTKLMQQLTEKANLLGLFINTVQMNIDTVERSLRRVRCTGVKMEKERELSSKTYVVPMDVMRGDRSIQMKEYDEYKLTFNDLTISNDIWDRDQALLTLGLAGGQQSEYHAVRAAKAVAEKFSPFGKLTEYMQSVKFEVTLVCPSGDLKTLIEGKQISESEPSQTKAKTVEETVPEEDPDSDQEDAKPGYFTSFVEVVSNIGSAGAKKDTGAAAWVGDKGNGTKPDDKFAKHMILEKVIELDMQISGFEHKVEIEDKTNDQPTTSSDTKPVTEKVNLVTFPFDKVTAEFQSLSVEVEMCPELVQKAVDSPNTADLWNTLKTLPHISVQLCSEAVNNDTNTKVNTEDQQSFSQSLFLDEKQRKSTIQSQLLSNSKQTSNWAFTSLKFIKIRNPEEMEKVLTSLKSTLLETKPQKGFILDMTLTLHDLVKNKEKLVQSYMDALGQYKNRTTLYVSKLSKNVAQDVIPWMRHIGMKFQMEINKLNLKSAEILLKHACLTQEAIQQSKIEEFSQMFMKDRIPLQEIHLLSARGISILVTFNEKLPLPYISILCLCAIAAVQVAIGARIFCTGFGATMGISLITEGFSEVTTISRAISSRQFSWSSYAKQKAISLTITAVCLGMTNIKDGIKGAKVAFASAGSEYAATTGFTSTIQSTGTILNKQAMKHIGVSAMETTGRLGIKAFTDQLSGFCFNHLREKITNEVDQLVKVKLEIETFYQLLSVHWTLENIGRPAGKRKLTGVQQKIDAMVQSTLNPASNFWRRQWESIGSPLANGILADPKFVGSGFNTVMLVWGALSGVAEIRGVVDKVSGSILKGLRDDSVVCLLVVSKIQERAGLSMAASDSLKPFVKVNFVKLSKPEQLVFEVDFTSEDILHNLSEEDQRKVKHCLKDLNELQQQFDPAKVTSGISMMTRSVVNTLTTHIIRVADSHLVSPVMSKAGGLIIAKISAEIQDRFLVHKTSEQYLEMKSKVDELKKRDPSDLTEADKAYLSQYDRKMTVASETHLIAKAYVVAYQRRERVLAILDSPENTTGPSSEQREKVRDTAAGVAGDEPANDAVMMQAAKDNNLEIVLTTDPNQKLTQEQIDRGVKLILREPPVPGDPSGIGHFVLLDQNGEKIPIGSQSGPGANNCGFEIIAALTDPKKDWQTVRAETAESIWNNPEKFQKVEEIGKWIQDRYPHEAKEFMFVAGRKAEYRWTEDGNLYIDGRYIRQSSQIYQTALKRKEWMERAAGDDIPRINVEEPAVKSALDKGPRKGELAPGYAGGRIYQAKADGYDDRFKVGKAEDVTERMKSLTTKNKTQFTPIIGGGSEEYDMNTPLPFFAETLATKQLKSQELHSPIPKDELRQGGTEFYRDTQEDMRPLLKQAVDISRENCRENHPDTYNRWLSQQPQELQDQLNRRN